jgi:hypothetical protein
MKKEENEERKDRWMGRKGREEPEQKATKPKT